MIVHFFIPFSLNFRSNLTRFPIFMRIRLCAGFSSDQNCLHFGLQTAESRMTLTEHMYTATPIQNPSETAPFR